MATSPSQVALISKTNNLAKHLGFEITSGFVGRSKKMVLHIEAAKKTPMLLLGKYYRQSFQTMDEVYAWLQGWDTFQDYLNDGTNIDTAEIKELIKQKKVLDKLKED